MLKYSTTLLRVSNARTSRAALLVLLLAAGATSAHAQICFPPADGVPGSQGAPDWWSPGATPAGTTTTSFLEDPRWRGALSHDVLEYERFRVVVETSGSSQFLVMSWQVRADLNNAGDRLYFGLWDDASSTGNVYRLTRMQDTQTAVAGATQAAGAFSGRVFAGSGPIGTVAWTRAATIPPPPLPAWLTTDARVDVTCSSPPSTGCDRWAFRIRAPLSAAANPADTAPTGFKLTGPNFHFWYEIQDSAMVGSATYAFPSGIVNAHEGGIPPIVLPDPSTWKAAKFGSGAGCESDVSLQASGVWVNSSGSSTLNMTSNEFHARPVNNTADILHNDAVTAKFRVANWGSVDFASPEWRETCTSMAVGGNITSGNPFDLRCTWSGFDACPYRAAGDPCGPQAGTKSSHQCILVDLSNTTGTLNTLVFSPQSVSRNMDFDVNSVLTREAIIDTRGLPPMADAAPRRDVYLRVQTRNLPARAPRFTSAPGATGVSAAAPTSVALPANVDAIRVREISALRSRFKELQLPSQGTIDVQSSLRIQQALLEGRITLDQVEVLMPTYTVFVWHDTGRTIQTESGTVKVLAPQPSFGLFLAHDGDLEGWEHRFEGAEQIGENLYKITAEKDGVTRVTATIAPKGELPAPRLKNTVSCSRCDVAPRNPDSQLAIFATLAFVAFVFFRIRRRRGVS
jgi:hypothetical protein